MGLGYLLFNFKRQVRFIDKITKRSRGSEKSSTHRLSNYPEVPIFRFFILKKSFRSLIIFFTQINDRHTQKLKDVTKRYLINQSKGSLGMHSMNTDMLRKVDLA